MKFGEMIAVVGLIVLLGAFNGASAQCNLQEVARPCFEGMGANRVTLGLIQQFFQDGMDATCTKLNAMVGCVENKTRGCDDPPSTAMRARMRSTVEFLCVRKLAEFKANSQCLNSAAFKTGMDTCQEIIDRASTLTCQTVTETIGCTDTLTDRQCPNIAQSLGHLLRDYLINRSRVVGCNIPHSDEHDHDDHDPNDASQSHEGHAHNQAVQKQRASGAAVLKSSLPAAAATLVFCWIARLTGGAL